MGKHHRPTGRHRAPSTAGRTAVRWVTAGMALGVPWASTPAANASAGMPANVREAVIACESGNRNIEHGGDAGGVSTASGYYQFVNGTWRAFGGTEFAPRAIGASRAEQSIVADRAYAANGLSDWDASRSCWEPKVGRGAAHDVAASTVRDTALVTPSPGSGSYVVRRGDTLSKIAAVHHTTWRKLYAANCGTIADPDLIHPGERIRV